MNKRTYQAAVGGLLHDVGKLCFRAGTDCRGHSKSGADFVKKFVQDTDILDCIRLHHRGELCGAAVAKDSPAYAVYIADNIASGSDRRESGDDLAGFDPCLPLASVFDTMKNKRGGFYAAEVFSSDKITYPQAKDTKLASCDRYKEILDLLAQELAVTPFSEEYVDSILSLTECCMCYVPSSTAKNQISDISLFDHSKLTAGIAMCISEYLIDRGEDDWTRLLDKSNDFYGEKAFLLFSADISGIQNFIYSIVSKGAMRSLKTRSAWLELLMESFIDEMLDLCGLSRACLIYSGGGHCYILLPNISSVKDTVKKTADAYNAWLMRQYGSDLYIAAGYAEATANDLMNKPESSQDKAPLNELFITLSRTISQKKLHRYSAEDIRFLNSDSGGAERECVNCGRSSVVLDKNSICEQCASFVKTAALLGRPGNLILVTRDKPNCPCLEFPSTGGSVYMSFDLESNIRKFIAEGGKYIRVYSKNKPYIGLKFSRNIFMGEYSYNNGGSLEELADDGKGFRRVSVLRADVDNLGAAFINGFVKDGKTESERHFYNTLSRKAAFSRQMSVFFRCCINNLLEKPEGLTIYKRNSGEERKKAAVVYSGGDDLFIVGAWADVIESAINIRDAFKKYCGGALTLSAGMGIYEVKYPVIKSAVQTGDLESSAKERFEDKDAAALFSDEMIYKWDVLRDEIIGEKLAVLKSLISDNIIDRAIGNSALYNILGLLKDAENDKINLARFAYQLARLAPTKNTNSEKYKSFRTVSGRLYTWAVDAKSRKQLITAIYIYVYLTRKEEHNV